jgi:hypothetical protein
VHADKSVHALARTRTRMHVRVHTQHTSMTMMSQAVASRHTSLGSRLRNRSTWVPFVSPVITAEASVNDWVEVWLWASTLNAHLVNSFQPPNSMHQSDCNESPT